MASWLELLFNIIGYGGFVLIASRHQGEPSVAGPDVHDGAQVHIDRM
ncbi:hypothetical protein [Bradyrhizobium sp. USDA 4353]